MDTLDSGSVKESLRSACGECTDKRGRKDTHGIVVDLVGLVVVFAIHNNGNAVISPDSGFPLRGRRGLARFSQKPWVR